MDVFIILNPWKCKWNPFYWSQAPSKVAGSVGMNDSMLSTSERDTVDEGIKKSESEAILPAIKYRLKGKTV